MKRWIRVLGCFLVIAALEMGLLARGAAHSLLNDSMIAGSQDFEAYEKARKNLEFIEKMTFYTMWIPRSAQDSQQAYGRKIARKWRLRQSLEDS